MKEIQFILSVVIISHNQREVLRRCIESVLCQKTSFPVQVIVSDDRSSDGTREMLTREYSDKVISSFFDSDKYETSFTLERASLNRINGLQYATGKYLINIDGDDFFTSTDLFQTMVDLLEKHPECTMCCQNYCKVDSADVNIPHIPENKSDILQQDCIITGEDFYSKVGYLHASCFLVRRENNVTFEDVRSIPYDDNTIPIRYINRGKVAILNRCDFVYVQYGQSSCSSMSEDDKSILFLPEFFMTRLAPYLAGVLIRRNLGAFSYVSKYVLDRKPISLGIKRFFNHCDIFILKNLDSKLRIGKRIRYRLIYLWTSMIFAIHFHTSLAYRILYRLAIGKISPAVRF